MWRSVNSRAAAKKGVCFSYLPEQIGQVINQISDISSTIASAVEGQSVTTNEISRCVAEAARGVTEITQNVVGVAEAAKNASTGAAETQTAAQELAQLAGEMQEAVNQFKYNAGEQTPKSMSMGKR